MSVIVLLMFASLVVAVAFLALFVWAVRRGQYEDMETPAMRMLTDDELGSRKENGKGLRHHE
ncbi:MAG: cbb3-type cytochrome oxidase assembly protein CcoS [Deltaproteobacteria bacterium]|nr:cbb3-type cytochrome oxidase assembly protein CcoS [Deltaproteobacteria bacterium]